MCKSFLAVVVMKTLHCRRDLKINTAGIIKNRLHCIDVWSGVFREMALLRACVSVRWRTWKLHFQDFNITFHASVKFSCDIREGRKAIEKKSVKSSPSTHNGAMRDDGWWQYTLQQKMCFLSVGPPSLVLGPLHSYLYHRALAWEHFWSVWDPTKQPSPVWDLSPWAASTFEPHCWASDQVPQENIGKP